MTGAGGLAVHHDVVGDGVRIVTVPRPMLSRTHVVAQLRAGPVHEDDTTWGMSHLVEHMVFRGTDRHKDVHALTIAVDELGGDLGAATWRDRVAFDTRVDVDRVGDAFDVLASMIAAPRFSQLAVERGIVEEEISDLFDDDGNDVDPENATFACLFAGHPLARSIEGRPEVLATFNARAVRAFHQRLYVAPNLVVSVAGPVARKQVVEAARRAFKRIAPGTPGASGAPAAFPPRGSPPRPTRAERAAARDRVRVIRSEKTSAGGQTGVRLCAPVVGMHHGDAPTVHMLARLLDDGPASRLQARLVDRDGLAYSIWAMADLYEERGCLELGGSVRPESAADLLQALRRELRALARTPPSAEELRRIVARAERDARDARDDPAALAEAAGKSALFGRPFQPGRDLVKFRQVRPGDVQRIAREAVDSAWTILSGAVPQAAMRAARARARA